MFEMKKSLFFIMSILLILGIFTGCFHSANPSVNSSDVNISEVSSQKSGYTDSSSKSSSSKKASENAFSSNQKQSQIQSQAETSSFPQPPYTKCNHEYTVENVPPTCSIVGYKKYTCKLCNFTYSTVLKKEHSKQVTTTPATCLTKGSLLVSCIDCGEILSRTELAALGHKFSSDGKCTLCGYEKKEPENVSSKEPAKVSSKEPERVSSKEPEKVSSKEEEKPVTSAPAPKIKIYIDQGHNMKGAPNAGAQGNGLDEGQITYKAGILLKDLLQNSGKFEVKVSRPSDSTVLGTNTASSLKARYKEANDWGADYFISLHCNSASAASANGIEVLTYSSSGAGYDLGLCILNSLIAETGLRNRGMKPSSDLAVLKHTAMPAALVEMGFISNKTEAQMLSNNLDVFVNGIYKGILSYFGI